MGFSTVGINNLPQSLEPNAAAPVKVVPIAAVAGTLETLGSFAFDAATQFVMVSIEAAPVRTDPSGNAPTSSNGQPVAVGQTVLLSRAEAGLGQWIRSTAVSATAQVTQYKRG